MKTFFSALYHKFFIVTAVSSIKMRRKKCTILEKSYEIWLVRRLFTLSHPICHMYTRISGKNTHIKEMRRERAATHIPRIRASAENFVKKSQTFLSISCIETIRKSNFQLFSRFSTFGFFPDSCLPPNLRNSSNFLLVSSFRYAAIIISTTCSTYNFLTFFPLLSTLAFIL